MRWADEFFIPWKGMFLTEYATGIADYSIIFDPKTNELMWMSSNTFVVYQCTRTEAGLNVGPLEGPNWANERAHLLKLLEAA